MLINGWEDQMVNLYSGFNFGLLDDPDFREDSVREELVVPLLAELGYSASGPNRIIRGRPLIHPYVYIGSRKQPITIVPDYILQRNGRNRWILDAKAPAERIDSGKNTEQAYSYAVHKDVRVPFYALCNGRELAVYHISEGPAVFHAPLDELSDRETWKFLLFLVGADSAMPNGIPIGFRRDYGLHIRKSGIVGKPDQLVYYIFQSVPLMSVCKVEDDLYCVNAIYGEDDEEFMLTVDFGPELLGKLLDALPPGYAERIRAALSRQPYRINFPPDAYPNIGVIAKPGEKVHKNANESYCPFEAREFI